MSTCTTIGCEEEAILSHRCREHLRRNPPKVRRDRHQARLQLLRQYGLTPEQYDELLAAQDGVCAICAQPEPVPGRRLAVDHDHQTGEVRGLLCGDCNRALGMFHDDTARMAAAIAYLDSRS